jgi:hypothetical protein
VFRGEQFYRDARRALWIAATLTRRGVTHLHAARASALVCAWLVKHIAGMKVTCRLGPRLRSQRDEYELLRGDFDANGAQEHDPDDERACAPRFRSVTARGESPREASSLNSFPREGEA